MKKFLFIALVSLLSVGLYSQVTYGSYNRSFPAEIDESLDGVWHGPNDSIAIVADSIYLYKTGLPDYGDLYVPDLELKMKSVWFGTKVYFLLRHLDDSLVNGTIAGEVDASIKPGLENRDATALYLFLDNNKSWLDFDSSWYADNSYKKHIAWFRWVWESEEFEGELLGDPISSIEELGGEMIQWNDGTYRYAKLSIDVKFIDSTYMDSGAVNLIGHSMGFEVELTENDKEISDNGMFAVQTRAFMGKDLDSVPLEPRNVTNWSLLTFQSGDSCVVCGPQPSSIRMSTSSFASIYPNPASSYIQVQLEDFAEVEYRIVDLMGRTIKVGTLIGTENTIKLENIQPGTYYLNMVTDDNKVMTKKLLIFN